MKIKKVEIKNIEKMKKISKPLYVLFLLGTIAVFAMQGCWKDRTILDKLKDGDPQPMSIDITPGYGTPLFVYHATCEDFLKHINEQYLDDMFGILFNEAEDNLAYFLYEHKLNIRLDSINMDKPTFDTVAKIHLIDWGLKDNSMILHRANFLTNVENYYNAIFTLNQINAFHEDANGTKTPLTLETTLPISVEAVSAGTPGTRLVNITTDNPISLLQSTSYIGYDIKSNVNKISSTQNGHLDFKPDIYMPLWLTMNNLTVTDTIDLDVSEYVGYNDSIKGMRVTEFTLMAKLENYFPLKASVMMTLLDENYHVLGTMYSDYQHVDAATFGSNFKVTTPATAQMEKTVVEGDDLYKQLIKTRYAEIKQIYTSNGKEVKLFKENYLKVKMNLVFKGQLKGDVDDIVDDIESK